jgi:hypothetical protein
MEDLRSFPGMRLRPALSCIAAALFLCAGPAQAAHPAPSRFLSVDRGHRLIRLTLVAALDGSNNGFNFDGYGRGELLVRVPLGWKVVVDCENRGGGRHSCSVVRGSLSTTPAFAGATSADPLAGLAPGAKESFSFVVNRVGTFRIASLVPGQEQARMYAVLDVTRGGRSSISARPGP